MTQDRREPLSDHEGANEVRPQGLEVVSPIQPKAEKLASGVSDGEKRMWLSVLRSGSPMAAEDQAELADILERQWFPNLNGGRPSEDTWTTYHRTNRALRAWGAESLIRERVTEGMKRADAEEEVAGFFGMERRALRRMLSGK